MAAETSPAALLALCRERGVRLVPGPYGFALAPLERDYAAWAREFAVRIVEYRDPGDEDDNTSAPTARGG